MNQFSNINNTFKPNIPLLGALTSEHSVASLLSAWICTSNEPSAHPHHSNHRSYKCKLGSATENHRSICLHQKSATVWLWPTGPWTSEADQFVAQLW